MKKIPIFIIVHNHYEILKKTVESYEKIIKSPIEIIFHNVASFYFETIQYLEQKKKEKYKIYHSHVNNHHSVIYSVKDYISKNPSCEYVVITDPDIELFNENGGDILEFYIYLLNKLNKTSIGPMLEINDIPNEYYNKKLAVQRHKNQFWNLPRKNIIFKNNIYQYIECNTDTTFQLFSSKNIPKTFPHSNSIRVFSPYSAKHLDWYINSNNITPCELFYSNSTTNISHWNNNKWNNSNIKIKSIHNSFKIKHLFVFYYDKCKSINNYNFGDFITPFIYESLFRKKPILDIQGGQFKKDVIFGAGSILICSKPNSIIWGTGFMFGNETIQKPKKILSVRGPLTRKRLLEQKIYCPEIYGDIGLILPYFYYPVFKKIYRLGIIPHYVDKQKFDELYIINDPDIKIIDVTQPIQDVIYSILQCKMTLSSSLHGIIVSHAYNIKSMWIKITDKIGGGYFKFRDYYGSLNIKNYNELLPYTYEKQIHTNKLIELANNYPNPMFPINTKHIIELIPFINIKKTN